MPFYSKKLLLILRLIYNKVIGGQKDIDSHVWIIEIFRVKEFTKLFSFFETSEERKNF